ncbi:MAG: 4Fe-4S dicluster domain-containing protein [Desulfoarculaceae bacterium]|nr:4Fe-4S dicluster domain-containing protein [Desulfoarculaceae bacterium]
MLFKVFPEAELTRLFELLAKDRIVGPVKKGEDQQGRPLYDFDVVHDLADLHLDYTQTIHSAKNYFLPYREDLCTFTFQNDDWQKEVDYGVYAPLVLLGLHPCDINALNKLDKVLLGGRYPNPFYGEKRGNMFIVGHSCTPQPFCFCQSMGTDSAIRGFDLFLTRMGDLYFAEILSPRALHLLEQIDCCDPDSSEHRRYLDLMEERESLFVAHVDTSDLTKILDLEFQSPVWQEWGQKCLSCGTCAQVCPTCYCYGVTEQVDMDFSRAWKEKQLYSCNLLDFASVAGSHNFRPESHTRIKYRYYHKHRGFVEAFEESLCVGCGRCGQACLARITVPEVIASVRAGKE